MFGVFAYFCFPPRVIQHVFDSDVKIACVVWIFELILDFEIFLAQIVFFLILIRVLFVELFDGRFIFDIELGADIVQSVELCECVECFLVDSV